MTFPILGGNGAVADVQANSLRFNDDDNPNLNRTFSSSGSRTTWTFSTWVKKCEIADTQFLFGVNSSSNPENNGIYFRGDDKIQVDSNDSGNRYYVITNALFRDVIAYYHILVHWNTTDGTASNRFKVYVNGVEQSIGGNSYPPQNYEGQVNRNVNHRIGGAYGYTNTYVADGYLAETYFIDGQALSPTDFGEFDEDSGIWKPKEYEGTYGTNGFKLDFSDSGSLGADSSGNGNNFTATNLASTDQTTDTPTNNFCTLNSIYRNGASSNIAPTYSEGNTITNSGGSGTSATRTSSTFEFSSGKWYWEVKVNDSPSAVDIGINNNAIGALCGIRQDGTYFTDNNNQGTLTSFTSGDIISFAFDMDNKKMYIAKNGTYMNSANPSTSTNGISFTTTDSMHCQFKSRQDDSLSANFGNPPFSITSGNSDDNGYGNFEYAPPSGYLALCTQNLATELSPTIDDGSQYFNTVTYTGDGAGSNSITGVGFQPDWTWIKARSQAYGHMTYDSVRGADKQLGSESTSAENDPHPFGTLSSFDSDGFTVGTGSSNNLVVNQNGTAFVSWNWKASGSTASNTNGSITSTVSANQTAGFSIVTYTGTGSNATVGHGLSKAPEIIIVKNRDYSPSDWQTGSDYLTSWAYRLKLNGTNAEASVTSSFNSTAPTSTVINIGNNDDVNRSGDSHLIYAFHSVEGYSKIGTYTGNGSTDGTFVYTGFKPAFVLTKRTDGANQWTIFDNGRDPHNVVGNQLAPNTSNAEEADASHSSERDFVSNGFKMRAGGNDTNSNGANYIYMAIGHTFVDSNGVPNTAR